MGLKESTRQSLQRERENFASIVRSALADYEEGLERLADAVSAEGDVTINSHVNLSAIPAWKRLLSCLPITGRFVRVPAAGLTVPVTALGGPWVDKITAALREVAASEAILLHLINDDPDFEVTNIVTSVYTSLK